MSDRDKRFPGCPPSLGDIINRSGNRGFLYFAGQTTRLFKIFDRVIGPDYSRYISAYGYFMGVLFVRTGLPAYVERFNYIKKEWIRSINIEMGIELISDIKIKVLPKNQPIEDLPDSLEFQRLSEQINKNDIDNPE
jgi:hypothetical protein